MKNLVKIKVNRKVKRELNRKVKPHVKANLKRKAKGMVKEQVNPSPTAQTPIARGAPAGMKSHS